MRHHHVCTVAALAVATGISSMALAAVEVKPIVLEGYNVPGVGNIQSGFGASETHAVNNSGRWVVESDTDNANTDTDGVIVTGTGFSLPPLTLLLRHQDAVTAPAGATISSFDSVTINNSGNSAYNHFLDFTTGGNDDSGVYFNNTLVIQESSFATASGLSADTPYIGFNDVKLNNNNQMMLMGNVDDSAIASTVDNVLVRIEPGTFAQTLYAKEGDSFFTFAATGFTTGVHSSAFNDSAQYLTSVDTADANTATDGAVIRFDGPSGHVVLAREGSPSAVAGRNWGTIFDVPLDMNNSGAWVMRGDLDGATTDDSLIVKNGTDVIAREGSSLASIGGVFTFTSFGTGGVAIDDSSNVFWVGDWNDADLTKDIGIFMNGELLVQEGVTLINGVTLATISTVQDNISISDNGQWLTFEGVLSNGLDGAFLVSVPEPASAGLLLGLAMVPAMRRRSR